MVIETVKNIYIFEEIHKLTTFLFPNFRVIVYYAFRIRQTGEEPLLEKCLLYLSGNHFLLFQWGGLQSFLREHGYETVVWSELRREGLFRLSCYYVRDGILQPEGSTTVGNDSCVSSKQKTSVCVSCYSCSEHYIPRLCQHKISCLHQYFL